MYTGDLVDIEAASREAVRGYYEAMFMGGTTAVTPPLKVVIVGKETVGKTSLRRSITTGKPCMTRDSGVESTVHVNVEDHKVDGRPIRIFDCAGQAVKTWLSVEDDPEVLEEEIAMELQAVDEQLAGVTLDDDVPSEEEDDDGMYPVILHPVAQFTLFDTMFQSSAPLQVSVLPHVDHCRQVVYYGLLQQFLTPRAVYLLVWDTAKASEMNGLNLEDLAIAPRLRCLTFRVPDANMVLVGNKLDRVAKARRTVADDLESESRQWLNLVSCSPSGLGILAPSFGARTDWPCGKSTPELFHRIIFNPVDDKRAVTMHIPPGYQVALEMLEELASSSRRKAEQRTRGITRADLEQKWQAKVAELNSAGTPVAAPEAAMSGAILISHKRDLDGHIDLGGIRVPNDARARLDRLDRDHVFEPKLAEGLWSPELASHLLLALKSAGLTFPLPQDSNGGLVINLRMDTTRLPEYGIKLEQVHKASEPDLKLTVKCSFSLGLPLGFVERFLAQCCHVGYPYPFWRYGALIVDDGDKILALEVFGGCEEVHAWAALSKVLSVVIKMLTSSLPRPGSCLVEESYICQLCQDRAAGIDLLAAALQVLEFSDEKFFDEPLREQFAENAKKVARKDCALWPGMNYEVGFLLFDILVA
ncbi:unnamed protein product [Ectocarpus sp. CCAP 1310/34]|nr:unnamed protein product [Ectocarpus sp. CCAP 1310/34]